MLGTIPGGMLCRRGLSRTVFCDSFFLSQDFVAPCFAHGKRSFPKWSFPMCKAKAFPPYPQMYQYIFARPGAGFRQSGCPQGRKGKAHNFPAMKAARKQAVSPQSGPDCFRAIGVLFPKGFCWGFSARRKIFALGAKISCYKFVTIRLNLLFLYPESNEECESLTGRRGGKVSPFLPLKEVKTILSTYY